MLTQLLLLTFALAPSLVSGALFPPDSLVKQLDGKGFKKAMKENRTSIVAFVAPWCGHCQKMVPEYSKAALGLYPLIPAYAVDCDAEKNRALCAEQGVKGFPTVKLFPRGREVKPITFDGAARTASSFFYWATRRVPNNVKKLYHVEDIEPWVNKNINQHRVLLLNKGKSVPLLWQVLGNTYHGRLEFGHHRDRRGKSSVKLGYPAGGKKDSKVLVYPAGSASPVFYEGLLKQDSLSKFFDSVLDGTADLTVVNEEAKAEEFELSEEELEIERKQEAQRMALAHGGFSDMIDFEEAVKKYGADFHDSHGYAGMMNEMPLKKQDKEGGEGKDGKKEDPIHKILKAQKEAAEKKAAHQDADSIPKTGDGGQIVLEVPTETGHSQTAHSRATKEPSATPESTDGGSHAEAVSQDPIPSEAPTTSETVKEATTAASTAASFNNTPTPSAEPVPDAETDEDSEEPEHVRDEL